MKVPAFDLSRQNKALGLALHAAFERVMSSGQFILGKEVEELEREIAQCVGAAHAVACASGTDALWLALRACDIGPGDVVLTSPFTFFATASAIVGAGATPAFVDIEAKSFLIDPDEVGRALRGEHAVLKRCGIRPETIKAVIPVHLYGEPVDCTRLRSAFGGRTIKIVEDGAQALGAAVDGQRVGVLGDIACFSFFPTKNLGAFGDGGITTTNESTAAERLRLLRAHGSRVKYQHEIVGTNSRLDALQAALLRVKLEHLPSWTERRQKIARRYSEELSQVSGLTVPAARPRAEHVFHQYTVRAPGTRDALRHHLESAQVGSTVYYPGPAHLQPALASLGYRPGDLPFAEAAASDVLSLPIFPELSDDEQGHVIAEVERFFGKAR